jgi:predicted RNA polymerase sigma factor
VLESGGDTLVRDYTPEDGQTNPFLHMGLHLAIREQVSTNRPAGIAAVYRSLAAKLGDVHEAEHVMIEALGQALWQAQRSGLPPDETAYLESLRRLT